MSRDREMSPENAGFATTDATARWSSSDRGTRERIETSPRNVVSTRPLAELAGYSTAYGVTAPQILYSGTGES
ncbi:hypothetical protein EHW97_03715 [Aeromicrobium camelliae]|uniref:Uncharacterized protein n=1 Tax=Aeromicrobium camelliae TaxID=1538144 RepID=A0A3N6ZGV5_9ACTN|nr:hypothetical protein [Aeromicrobium camelliae]RQN09361.1 hypothetical protein EHW97_03715 [Aeromicrobium camelliae]